MAGYARIEGLDEALRAIDRSPAELLKLNQAAMRKAAQATLREVRGKLPSRWRKLAGAKVSKAWDGHTLARVGLYNTGDGDRKSMDWFKAYWKNYGTLKHRDPSHHFDTPVKAAKPGRRNNEGQRAEHFFEAAMSQADATFTEVFESEIDRTIEQIL